MRTAINLDALVPLHVRLFEPYIPSRPDAELKRLYRCDHLYRLNNNENPLGPPAAAQAVIAAFDPQRASEYPSGDAYYLRQALAQRFKLDAEQFIVGNGANEVIAFVMKAFCEQGDNIITADRTFAVYEWVARFSGIEARLVPLRDFAFDDEAMLQQISERTKVIFVCNPNNPTGTYWNEQRLRRFLDRVGPQRIVVLDEAYAEFVEQPDFPDGMKLLREYDNLIVFRTFSKMYGLAGLRIGYLATSLALTDIIRRTGVVYSVNAAAQQAALAALNDDAHVAATRQLVRQEKHFLLDVARELELPAQSGEGCFVMMRLPVSDMLAYRKMMQQGVMIRSMTGFRYPNWIRISIGVHESMQACAEALRKVVHGK
ncbi:MAG: histidinol phosphate aminotransferase apoenzyme [Burkholderiaceae bacterium]|nr:histidinol phosphate aminotransferase apoenzyme [Burkholderiaceae bacterium]